MKKKSILSKNNFWTARLKKCYYYPYFDFRFWPVTPKGGRTSTSDEAKWIPSRKTWFPGECICIKGTAGVIQVI